MKEFLAKSNGELLETHIKKVLSHFNDFMSIYDDFFNETEKEAIRIACEKHDEGKKNPEFQEKIREKTSNESKKNSENPGKIENKVSNAGERNSEITEKIGNKTAKAYGEIPHGVLSCAFLDEDELGKKFSNDDDWDYFIAVYQAIYNHHTRNFNFSEPEVNDYIENKLKEYLKDDMDIGELNVKSHSYGKLKKQNGVSSNYLYKYFRVKGLLNKFDYAASAVDETYLDGVERAPIDPSDKVRGYLKRKYNAELNKCQRYMAEHSDENLVVTASTGSGKTEGALLWAGKAKTFYTLPLKVSIDAIFLRLRDNGYFSENDLGHLHSDTLSFFYRVEDRKPSRKGEAVHFTETESGDDFQGPFADGFWERGSAFDEIGLLKKRARAFIYPATVCTVDQLFTFVFKAPGLEILPATLSYGKLIIDEIQAYSPEILAYLVCGLKIITEMGGKFCIMTATLPPFLIKALEEEKIAFAEPESFLSDVKRHKIKIIEGDFNYQKIAELGKNKKILVICNTVKRAQQAYDEINRIQNDGGADGNVRVELLHSRFIKDDRFKKEDVFKAVGDKNSGEKGVFISTQIVEASLDIDFDELHTDMSTADSLLQRLGRCYRGREYKEKGANVFVYAAKGNDVKERGIGKVYDKDIYKFSLEFLKEYEFDFSGEGGEKFFTEEEKMKYIEKVYGLERIQNTEYYKTFKRMLKKMSDLQIGDYEKAEAKNKFRDITNVMVIPNIFKDELNAAVDSLRCGKGEEKTCAYDKLKGYSVSISYPSYCRLKKDADFQRVADTDYYFVNLVYDDKKGLTTKIDDEAEAESRFF
jgi:CRISPR-associated endonuclease/helicase Cas3